MEKSTQELEELIVAQQKKIARLQELVERDELTGLLNRKGFVRRLGKVLKDLEGRQLYRQHMQRSFQFHNVALLFVDVNKFKSINDTYGHEVGDDCLKGVASILSDSVRGMDIVGRWSGDEFVVALLGSGLEGGMIKADRINDAFLLRKKTGKDAYPFPSVSIGVCAAKEDGRDPECIFDIEQLLSCADERMYSQKKLKKND